MTVYLCLKTYVAPHLKPGDSIVISEKVIAIMQGRAFPIETIKPSWLAKKLSQQVLQITIWNWVGKSVDNGISDS